MRPKSTFFSILIFPFFLGIFLSVPTLVSAKTVYVNQDGDDSDEGSSDHPFKTLEEAAEEVNEGEADEIKIGKGSFPGDVTFTESVDIQGAGKGSTTLKGSLTFKKKVSLKNLSINTKAKNAVTLGKSSVANFEKVDIREFTGIGIWIQSGGGVLTLEDSRLGGSGGKGIYAEAGSKVTLIGNTIVNNKQEGVDIRQNTRGTIKNNTIEDNSESGIELIVGSSDFIISGNDIKKNGASGIAFQFYQLKTKIGTITATGNTISGNDKYGLDCNKPQAGDTPVGYWADSITLDGNTLASNKMADVSKTCKLIEAKTEEEEKILEQEVVEEEKKESELVQSEAEILDQSAEEKRNQENALLEDLMGKIEGVVQKDRYQQLMEQARQMKLHQVAAAGFKNQAVEDIRQQAAIDGSEIADYKGQMMVLGTYATRSDLQERVSTQEQQLAEYQAFAESYNWKKELGSYHVPFEPKFLESVGRFMIPEYAEQTFALGTYGVQAGVSEWAMSQGGRLKTYGASVKTVSQETIRRISKLIYGIIF